MNQRRLRRFLIVAFGAAFIGCSTTTSVRSHFETGARLYDEKNYAGAAREYRLAIERGRGWPRGLKRRAASTHT